MALNRLKGKEGFYCGSCKHHLIDFRNSSEAEILKEMAGRPVCGIFHEEQVQKPIYSYRNKFLFKALTVLALLGFQVKPLSAQSLPSSSQDTINIQKRSTVNKDIPTAKATDPSVPPTKKKKWWARKKKNKVLMGCPSF